MSRRPVAPALIRARRAGSFDRKRRAGIHTKLTPEARSLKPE